MSIGTIASIASFGVSNEKGKDLFHIYAIGFNNVKVYFYEDGTWGEDTCKKAESDDFMFVYNELTELLKDKEVLNNLQAALLF